MIESIWKNEPIAKEVNETKPVLWKIGDTIDFDSPVLCPKCGGQAKLLEYVSESHDEDIFQCLADDCGCNFQTFTTYIKKNNELKPMKCTLEKMW